MQESESEKTNINLVIIMKSFWLYTWSIWISVVDGNIFLNNGLAIPRITLWNFDFPVCFKCDLYAGVLLFMFGIFKRSYWQGRRHCRSYVQSNNWQKGWSFGVFQSKYLLFLYDLAAFYEKSAQTKKEEIEQMEAYKCLEQWI